jgi:outer membrane biosynthesis protein TonB
MAQPRPAARQAPAPVQRPALQQPVPVPSRAPAASPFRKHAKTDLIEAPGRIDFITGGSLLEVRTYWRDSLGATHTFQEGRVKAGPNENAAVPVYSWPADEKGRERKFLLARKSGGKWIARVPADPAVRAIYEEKGARYGRNQLERENKLDKNGDMVLEKGGRLTLSAGNVRVVVEELPAPPRAKPKLFKLDRTFAIQFGAIAVVMLAFIIFMPTPPPLSVQERPMPPPRAVFKPPEKKKLEKKEETKKDEKKEEEKKKEEPKAEEKAKAVPKSSKAPPPRLATPSWAIKALSSMTKKSNTQSILGTMSKMQASGGALARSNFRLGGIAGPAANPLGIGGFGGGGSGGPMTGGAGSLLGGAGGGLGSLKVGPLKGPGGAVAKAKPRTIQVRGSLSREEIAKVINDHMKEVQACYERALVRDPNITGKLLLEWTIDLGGSVTQAKIKESSMKNTEVGGCIVEHLRGWHFPSPKGGIVIVSYPFLFNSVGF